MELLKFGKSFLQHVHLLFNDLILFQHKLGMMPYLISINWKIILFQNDLSLTSKFKIEYNYNSFSSLASTPLTS